MALKPSRIKCPKCGSHEVGRRGSVIRTIRGIPVGHKKDVLFEVTIPKVHCPRCNIIRQVDISWFSKPNKSYTNSFSKEVLERIKGTPISKVSKALGIDWHTANNILKAYLTKHYGHIDFKGVKMIAIDEIAIASGHTSLTVVMDLATGYPIYVGEGKSEEALREFWALLDKRAQNIEGVAIDMSPAFTKTVNENLPDAFIVFDHFHVHKMAKSMEDNLPRYLFKLLPRVEKGILMGSRFLLLKNEENLDEERHGMERLEQMLSMNTPLTTAYIIKEFFRKI
jgi:transposase